MRDEIEDLNALADECGDWMRAEDRLARAKANHADPFAVTKEFRRLQTMINEIAKRLSRENPHAVENA